MQYQRISADCHLDMIWLPPDLFTSEAPRELKERMPFVSEGPNGKEWVARNGASFGLVAGVGSAGRKYEPGKQHRADREQGLRRNAAARQRPLSGATGVATFRRHPSPLRRCEFV